jgi:shikimate dehydrogenase
MTAVGEKPAEGSHPGGGHGQVYHLGLIGYPLGHSRSPQLHHAALQALGLDGEYSLFPIPPLPEGAAQIAALIERLRAGELHGLNVTIPHKPSVMPHVDVLSDVARAVGAVNTLYMDGQKLVGENTDVPGFLRDLEKLTGAGQPAAATARWCWARAVRPGQWCMPWRGPAGR